MYIYYSTCLYLAILNRKGKKNKYSCFPKTFQFHGVENFCLGYRYEMYCASKSAKTTQVTVECAISTEKAWEFNLKRPESERYTDEAFKALCMRHEPPDSRNR